MGTNSNTQAAEYAHRLLTLGSARWKRVLDVQRPYRWNLKRLNPGFMLDVGCGIGRNLMHVEGVGIDHNSHALDISRDRGLTVYLPEDFALSPDGIPGSFDRMLVSHVLEHMSFTEGLLLVERYLPYIKPNGMVILICPQEAGYDSDDTHVEFIDFPKMERLCCELMLRAERRYSFPFPRLTGRYFKFNEFVVCARKATR